MSSGLNPSGSMCVGAVNTNTIILGEGITIDNTKTPAQIYINDAAYFYIPPPGSVIKDFSTDVPSSAGFNPSGTLRIGTGNTEVLDIGPLKIDNTVMPSQIFANGVALAPVEKPQDIDTYEYFLTSDATGDQNTLKNNVSFAPATANTVVSLINDGSGTNNIFNFAKKGVYEIQFNADVVANGFPEFETLGNVYLTSMSNGSVYDFLTGTYLVINDTISQSDIAFPTGESSQTITFNMYLTEDNTYIGVGTNMPGDIIISAYSFVKIRQIGTLA